MKITDLFKLPTPAAFVSKHAKNPDCVQPERLIGVELELEELEPDARMAFAGFQFTTDNSLRNSDTGVAREAVSHPLKLVDADGMLYAFWRAFNISEKNFSERCSIHVHVNALDMTVQQVASLCLVYQTVERLLFEFIGENRKNNIFCVPWHQSGLTYNYVNELIKDPNRRARSWQKYTALNILPLVTQGTLEFRHLHGTADLKKIGKWLQIIGCLFEYATSHTFEEVSKQIMQMNTISNYHEWLTAVFGKHADTFQAHPSFEQALSRGVVDSKFLISGNNTPLKQKTVPHMTTDELLATWRVRHGELNVLLQDEAVVPNPFIRNPGTGVTVPGAQAMGAGQFIIRDDVQEGQF
jgi:hypothetical protein